MKEREEHKGQGEPSPNDIEPLAGSGFEKEQPEPDFNGDSEESAEPEREGEQ